jgi:hypothetical protein
MSVQNLLVELFVEELPPKALNKLGSAFSAVLAEELKAQGLVAADAVVTHSYHVALWALEAGTPTLLATGSDYYEAKAEGLRALAGLTSPIALVAGPTVDTLERQLEAVRGELDPTVLAGVAARVSEWWDRALSAALAPRT